ncbi:putative MFS transporter [Papiliotrema laurentii]|uniref:MFS transporter n=1 Tax=Papiliotrema laurentii TaxID=5418 RepID=A0AAD9FTT5_PAPLA|nr:putative MFS transporter [Papiliotrema laurentii]
MGREVIPQDQSVSLPRAKLLILIFGLQTALLISFVDSTSVSTILPIIGKELDAAESITWAGTAFLVANTSFQIITSRLSDCFGRKIILLGSLFFFGFGGLLAGFAKNKVWLYSARAVAGIGGGGINSLTMIILSDVVTVRERGKYLSLLGIGIASGSAAGPFLGAILAEKVRWSWAFWIISPLAAVTMLLIQFTVPQKALEGDIKQKMKHMDWLGGFLSLTMTVCLLVPLSGGGSTFAWGSPVVIALFVVGGCALLAFIFVEGKVASLPLFPGRILKNRNTCLLIVQTWLVGMVFYGGIFFTPLYFQNILGVSPILSAALLLPLVISQVLTTTISGFIVKYTNRTWASFFVGFAVWLAGQGAQLCFDQWTSRSVIIGVLLLQGLGIGATIQSTLVLAQASGPPADRAAVTGVRNFARTSGGAVGLAVGNTILQNIFAKNLPTDLSAGLRQSLLSTFEIPTSLDAQTTASIRAAYMTGLRDVFIFFIPVVGICLVMCAFIKDLPLDSPKPILPKHSGDSLPMENHSTSQIAQDQGSETSLSGRKSDIP